MAEVDYEGVWTRVINELNIDLNNDLSPEIPSSIFNPRDRNVTPRCEARVAAKMDSSDDVPHILSSNGLFCLPVTSRAYVLVRGQGHHRLEAVDAPIERFQTRLTFRPVTMEGEGESLYVHHAHNSGLLCDVVNCTNLHQINEGRFTGANFDFNVGCVGPIHHRSSQVQVDGLFEDDDNIVIMEAKAGYQKPDFIIRQLYYPYRKWWGRTTKQFHILFMDVDKENNVFTFRKYEFSDGNNYESIKFVESSRYTIDENPYTDAEIDGIQVNDNTKFAPQADSVYIISNVPFFVRDCANDAKRLARVISETYNITFTPRQGLYYSEAVEALGLITRRREGRGLLFELTPLGRRYITMSPEQRNGILMDRILGLPLIRGLFESLEDEAQKSKMNVAWLTNPDVERAIESAGRYKKSTVGRRSQSVFSWFDWVAGYYTPLKVQDGKIYLNK